MIKTDHVAKKIKIEPLKAFQVDQAVKVFTQSFKNEALTSAWIKLYKPFYCRMFSILVKNRLLLDIQKQKPALCAVYGDKIVGLIIMSESNCSYSIIESFKLVFQSISAILALFPRMIIALLNGVVGITRRPASIKSEHLFVEILATHPDFMGKGIGTTLLKKAREKCLYSESLSGIYLFTGDEKNYYFYKKFGFNLIEKRSTKDITAWYLFLEC